MQYIDEDDFEYVAIDENEFTLDSIVFEDNFVPSKFQYLNKNRIENLNENTINSKNAIETSQSLKDHTPITCKITKNLIQENDKHEVKVAPESRYQSSNVKVRTEWQYENKKNVSSNFEVLIIINYILL